MESGKHENEGSVMIVSVTEVESFKRCRRQWMFGSFNQMALTPIIQPKPYLDLGTMVHKTLALWTHKPSLPLADIFIAIAHQHQKNTVDRYTQATGHEPTEEQIGPLLDAITLGHAMMTNYQDYYGVPLPDHLTYYQAEQEILIPIPNTERACTECNETGTYKGTGAYSECTACDGKGVQYHYLKARLDALAIDGHGNVYVIERKTYENRPNLALLEHSDQFIGYVWTAQQMQLGPVIGIAYDGMWKRATPPQRPRKLEIADLFCRAIIDVNQNEVEEYGTELARTVMEMASDPYIYKNRVWQGCWDCSFEQLCASMSAGDDVDSIIQLEYTRRTEEDVQDIAQSIAVGA